MPYNGREPPSASTNYAPRCGRCVQRAPPPFSRPCPEPANHCIPFCAWYACDPSSAHRVVSPPPFFFNIYCVQMSAKQPPLHWRRHPNALSSSSAPRSRSRTVLQPQPCRRPPQPCRPSSPASKSRTSSCASPLVRIRSCSRRRSSSTRSSTGPSSVLVSRQRCKPGPPRGAPGARPLPRLCRLQPDSWLRPD